MYLCFVNTGAKQTLFWVSDLHPRQDIIDNDDIHGFDSELEIIGYENISYENDAWQI